LRSVPIASDAIVFDPTATQQEMLGFGAAFTDAACYMLNTLHSDERASLMHELFAPDEMAMNVCRTCIGASDYSKSLYSFDDSEQDDPELRKFSIDHDKAYILPLLREARKLNPDLFIKAETFCMRAGLWYYRALGITFGGCDINKQGEICTNQTWKIIGYLGLTIHMILIMISTYYGVTQDQNIRAVQNSVEFVYYSLIMIQITYNLNVFINIWFIQTHGYEMLKTIMKYRIKSTFSNK